MLHIGSNSFNLLRWTCLGGHRFQWLIKLLISIKKLMVINYCSKIGNKHLKTLKNTGPHSVPLSLFSGSLEPCLDDEAQRVTVSAVWTSAKAFCSPDHESRGWMFWSGQCHCSARGKIAGVGWHCWRGMFLSAGIIKIMKGIQICWSFRLVLRRQQTIRIS